jgi:hypothetical protein
MFKRFGWAVLALLAGMFVFSSGSAYAESVGPYTACGTESCPKTTYYLEVNTGAGVTTIWLALDVEPNPVSNIVAGVNDHITAVAVQIADSLIEGGSNLTSAPSGVTWINPPVQNAIGENGCNGGGWGWVCSQAAGSGLLVQGGHTYEWTWTVNPNDNAVRLEDANISVAYGPGNDYVYNGQIHVPEPGMMTLLGAGLVGLVGAKRKLQHSQAS